MIGVEGGCFQFFCQLLQVSSTSGKAGAAVCDSTTHAVLAPPASPCLPHSCSSRRDPRDPPKPQSCISIRRGYPESCCSSSLLRSVLGAAPGLWDEGGHVQLPAHPKPPAALPRQPRWGFLPLTLGGEVEEDAGAAERSHRRAQALRKISHLPRCVFSRPPPSAARR